MSKAIYPSKYTNRKVTDAQYLCDEIMERIAKKEKKVLTYRYWNDPAWKKTFLRQLAEAHKLLKETDCVTIMQFLRSVKGRNIYSLGLKSQILAGAATIKLVDDMIKNNETTIAGVDEDFLTEESDNIKEYNEEKKGVSLWEKLG